MVARYWTSRSTAADTATAPSSFFDGDGDDDDDGSSAVGGPPPLLLMLWGTRDGVSPGGNDATCTLRWTVDVAFAKRRRGGVNVDVVVFRGPNHTVFCDPPDDTDFFRMGRRATSTADASVISYATSLPSLSLRGAKRARTPPPHGPPGQGCHPAFSTIPSCCDVRRRCQGIPRRSRA